MSTGGVGQRRVVRAGLVALAMLLPMGGAACAGTRPGAPVPAASRRAAAAPPYWATFAADIVAVRPTTDPRSVLIQASVSAGGPDCARSPRITMLDETATTVVAANVVYDTLSSARCPGHDQVTVTLTATRPLGDRQLVFNAMSPPWGRTSDGYRRCTGTFGCDPPPADPCDPGWIDSAIDGLDIPRHASRSVRHCDANWLIVEINETAADCGPVSAPRPGCSAAPRTYRWFLRFDNGWRVVTRTKAGGCADIRAAAPTFPSRLCANLPPTSG